MDLYGQFYPSQWAMVVAIMTGEAANWVVNLHSDHVQELTNISIFLVALRTHFEDKSRTQLSEESWYP